MRATLALCLIGLTGLAATGCGGGGGGQPANNAPTVTVNGATGSAPFLATLTATATDADGDPLTFSWDVDGDDVADAAAGNSTNLKHLFRQSTLVTVFVADGRGGQGKAFAAVDVLDLPSPVSLGTAALPVPLNFVGGNPAVALTRTIGSSFGVEYFQAVDATATDFGGPVPIPSPGASHTSPALVELTGGFPAVFLIIDGGILIAVNSAADGSGSWSTSSVLTTPNLILRLAAGLTGGRPLVCYVELLTPSGVSMSSTLGVAAGNGAWTAPVNIDIAGDSLDLVDMVTAAGNPAIAYRRRSASPADPDGFESQLTYARAVDTDATSWDRSVLPSENDIAADIAIVDDRPAVIANGPDTLNGTLGDSRLRYWRANDAEGTTWPQPVTVMENGIKVRDANLAVRNGAPIVIYESVTSGGAESDLVAQVALDNDGAVWSNPVVLFDSDEMLLGSRSVISLTQGLGIAVVLGSDSASFQRLE